MNGLTGSADHPAYISASKLQFEDDCSAAGNFREHHVIRKFDQLSNDELEKFSHASETNHEYTRIHTNLAAADYLSVESKVR
jgi:hypothetical protein